MKIASKIGIIPTEKKTTSTLDKTADAVVDSLKERFTEAKRNLLDFRPIAAAAGKLLDGTFEVSAEVERITGISVDMTLPKTHKPILLVASKFGTWASELTMVASVLLKAGYKVTIATEDGSAPHLLGPSLRTDSSDGAWRFPVVSDEEAALGIRYLHPGSAENKLFNKENIVDLSKLAKPPQVGDFLKDETLLEKYRKELKISMELATKYDAIVIAGGSGAIPGLMFDRGIHSLILAFHALEKPIVGECNGGLSILQTLEPDSNKPILFGRAVTTHSTLDEYQADWGWVLPFSKDPSEFWKNGEFDIDGYSTAEQWFQPGITGNPLIDSEGYFRDAAGAKGVFFSPPGSPYSVVVDGHFITCRTTPDGYPGVLCLIAVLDGKPRLKGRLFIDADAKGRKTP